MTRIKNFEEFEIWQQAREIVGIVYSMLKNNRDYGYKDQIQRASISVMSNISEGFERQTRKEFIQYLYISKGSCAEVRSLLYIGNDLEYFKESNVTQTIEATRKLSISINKLIQYLKNNQRS